jgi:hypothetical protein
MLNRSIALFGLLFSLHAFADASLTVGNAVATGAYSVGIGSTVTLKSSDAKIAGPAIFLGNAVKPDGSSSYQMFLNTKSKKAFYVESDNFSGKVSSKYQTVLDPMEQAGGTCTGYAIYDFLQQTNLSGFEGTGELAKALSTEEGRTNLLVDSVNRYYLELQHKLSISAILTGFGKNYGFACKSLKTDSYETAKKKVLAQLQAGSPVLFSFDIGPKMVTAPFSITMTDQKNGDLDNRLWIPRKTGEKNSGGHSIVAAGSFELNNKTYLVMIDSDWSEPRIWDMDSYLNDKTDLGSMEFVFCK